MFEHVHYLLDKISPSHLNIMILLGLVLFGGIIGGRVFQKLRIPQVVGYIVIGIIIGASGLGIVDAKVIEMLRPFNYFALGMIAFVIGGELKKDIFRKYGKQLTYTLVCEAMFAFFVVALLVGIVGTFVLKDAKLAWCLGFLLGAIASATDAASTMSVFWEYKTKGPLTTTTLGVVALDDALSFLLFAVISTLVGIVLGNGHHGGIMATLSLISYEIGMSIVVGILAGFLLIKILDAPEEEERTLTISIGIVLFLLGLSLAMNIEMLIAAMTLGTVVVNLRPRKSKQIFKSIGSFMPPIYVLFFVLVGASLNLRHVPLVVIVFVGCYLIGRSVGKMAGANFGARLSNSAKTVRKYLPLCLFSQASAAIGLAILASNRFPGEVGAVVVTIVTATTFLLQILGPPFVKIAVTKAGEAGLNITEEDLIRKIKTEEMMDKNPPLIHKNMHLEEILKIFSQTTNLYYPVVDKDKKLVGIISVDSIKNTFMEQELDSLLLADDLAEPAVAVINDKTTAANVKELLDKHNLDYLPVVNEKEEMVGFLERRTLSRFISAKIIELEKQSESLEQAV
ncbi:MAG: cation:proton antiporter [Candidatus Omnitrophota bacterium]